MLLGQLTSTHSPLWVSSRLTSALAVALICGAASQAGCRRVELVDALLEVVERQPEARPAEGVGEDEVRPGRDVCRMDAMDEVGVLDVPPLGWIARSQSPVEELGTHPAVSDDDVLGSQKVRECVHSVLFRQTAVL